MQGETAARGVAFCRLFDREESGRKRNEDRKAEIGNGHVHIGAKGLAEPRGNCCLSNLGINESSFSSFHTITKEL